jgi:hypothetical protein
LRTAVDLGFDPRYTDAGEGDPFTPAHNSV